MVLLDAWKQVPLGLATLTLVAGLLAAVAPAAVGVVNT